MLKRFSLLCCFMMVFLFSFLHVTAQDNEGSTVFFLYPHGTEQDEEYFVADPFGKGSEAEKNGSELTILEPTPQDSVIPESVEEASTDNTETEESISKAASVPGDMTGDGKVNALDLVRLKRYLGGENVTLAGSGDVTGDGRINALDLVRLKRFLGGEDVKIFGGTSEPPVVDLKYFTFTPLDEPGTCRISAYTGPHVHTLNIPSAGPDGRVVTEIGQMKTCSDEASCKEEIFPDFTIPSTVKIIREYAFTYHYKCGSGVCSGGAMWNGGNSWISGSSNECVIPEGVTSLPDYAFAW